MRKPIQILLAALLTAALFGGLAVAANSFRDALPQVADATVLSHLRQSQRLGVN